MIDECEHAIPVEAPTLSSPPGFGRDSQAAPQASHPSNRPERADPTGTARRSRRTTAISPCAQCIVLTTVEAAPRPRKLIMLTRRASLFGVSRSLQPPAALGRVPPASPIKPKRPLPPPRPSRCSARRSSLLIRSPSSTNDRARARHFDPRKTQIRIGPQFPLLHACGGRIAADIASAGETMARATDRGQAGLP